MPGQCPAYFQDLELDSAAGVDHRLGYRPGPSQARRRLGVEMRSALRGRD